jgi:hypothetical protein
MFLHHDNNQQRDSSVDGYVARTVHFYRDDDIESLKLFLRSDTRTDELIKELNVGARPIFLSGARRAITQGMQPVLID